MHGSQRKEFLPHIKLGSESSHRNGWYLLYLLINCREGNGTFLVLFVSVLKKSVVCSVKVLQHIWG